MPKEATCPQCDERFQVSNLDKEYECPSCGARFLNSSKTIARKPKAFDGDDDGKSYSLMEPEPNRPAFRPLRRPDRIRRDRYEEDDERDWDRGSANNIIKISILTACGVYLLFMLISLLWHSIAIIPLLIALLGAITYAIIFHAIIIQNEGLLAWFLIMIIPFAGLVYFLIHLEELGVVFLKQFGCWVAFWLAVWSVSETTMDAQPVVPVNDPAVSAPAAKDPLIPAVNPKRSKEPKERADPTPTDEPILSDEKVRYLSDLKEFDWVPGPVIWGWSFGKNGDLGDSAHSRIQVNRKKYSKGLGMTPPDPPKATSISYRLDSNAQSFKGSVAVDDSQAPSAARAGFEVLGDDHSLWKSKPIGKNGVIESFDIDVKGVKVLKLQVYAQGNTNFGCRAVWLNPYVVME